MEEKHEKPSWRAARREDRRKNRKKNTRFFGIALMLFAPFIGWSLAVGENQELAHKPDVRSGAIAVIIALTIGVLAVRWSLTPDKK